MRLSSLLAVLSVPGALVGCTNDPTPIVTAIPVASCAPSPALDELEVVAQGTVVDFLTGAPLAGVTVDVARAWEPAAKFPTDSCALARLTTDAAGRFGPVTVKIGPRPNFFDSKFILFLAQGADISPTASDARVTDGAIDHVIEAPSLELIDAWRSELDDGGMDNARTRGLIAFRYEDANRTPIGGVTAHDATPFARRTLERGDQVRYVSADRQTIESVSRSTTTESGLALIGLSPTAGGTREIGGARGADDWGSIGCLVGEGWVFHERSQPIDR